MPRRKPVNPQPSKKDDEEENQNEDGPDFKKTKLDREQESGEGEKEDSQRAGTLTRSAAAKAPASPIHTFQASPEPKSVGKKGKGAKNLKTTLGNAAIQVTSAPEEHAIAVDSEEIVHPTYIVEETTDSDNAVSEEDIKKSNLSMEALLQAANSELANIKQTVVPQVTVATTLEGASKPGVIQEATIQKLVHQDQEIIYVTLPSQDSVESATFEQSTPEGSELKQEKPVATLLRLDTTEGGKVQLPAAAPGQQTYRLVYAKNPTPSTETTPVAMTQHKPLILQKPGSKQPEAAVMQPHGNFVIQKPVVMPTTATPPTSVGRKRKHPAKPGKHICTYCGRGCAKPSVLQKHIRAHTGERPYPCIPCGFSFKTKSNLYKHCKSRSHAIKAGLAKGGDLTEGELAAQTSTDREDDDILDDEDDEEMDSAEGSNLDDGESIKSEENKDGGSGSKVESEGTPKQRFKKKMKEEQKEKESIAKQNFVLVQQPSMERPSEDFTAAQNLLMTETSKPTVQIVDGSHAGLKTGTVTVPGSGKPVYLDVVFVSQDGTPIQTVRSASTKPITASSLTQGKMLNQILLPNKPREMTRDDVATSVKVASISSMAKEHKLTSPLMHIMHSDELLSRSLSMPETPSFPVAIPVVGNQAETVVTSAFKKTSDKQMKVTIQLPKPNISPGKSTATPGTPVPKLPPVDTKNLTPEALRDRISMLISVNSQIVDTPMADAPRPKRVSRQNSEPVAKVHIPTSMKQLLSSQLSTTIAPHTAPVQTATILPAATSLPSTSTVLLSPGSITTHSQRGAGMTIVDVTPSGSTMEIVEDEAAKQPQQHFLGLAEPSDQPPGTMIQSDMRTLTIQSQSTSLKCSDSFESDNDDVGMPEDTSEVQIKFQLPPASSPEESFGEQPVSGNTLQVPSFANRNPEGSLIKDLLLKQRVMPPISRIYTPTTNTEPITSSKTLLGVPSMVSTEQVYEIQSNSTVADQITPMTCLGCNMTFDEKEQYEVHQQHLCPMSQSQTTHTTVTAEETGDMVILMNEDETHEPAIITEVAKEVELTSSTSPDDKRKTELIRTESQSNVMVEVVDPKQPPKRGRPKGSKNRPKDSPGAVRLPFLNVTKAQQLGTLGTSLTSTPLTGTPMTPETPTSQSLWKLKLKGKLLMKRSMSVERMLSQDKDKDGQSTLGASSPNLLSPMPETLGLNPRKQHPGLFQRSHSVDAVGLKKKPKLIREYSLHEESYTQSGTHNITIPVPGSSTPGVASGHTLNPPHEIVVIDEHNNTTEVILVQEGDDGEPIGTEVPPARKGFYPPINEVVQSMCYSKPMYAPNIHIKDQSVRLPPVINIPASLAQKIPGLIMSQTSESSKEKPILESNGSLGVDGPMEIDERECPDDSEDVENMSESGEAKPKDLAVNITGISKLLQEKVLVALLLLGHNYPSVSNTACATFCSLLKTQPMYVPQGDNMKISMYSNWRTAGFNPNPMGLTTKQMLGLYSTSKPNSDPEVLEKMSDISPPKSGVLTHSSYWNFKTKNEGNADDSGSTEASTDVQFMPLPDIVHVANDITVQTSPDKNPDHTPTAKERLKEKLGSDRPARIKIFPGGFKSNEDYTYVRGRGRGKYVCEECGIRCKKPSMLKKHIRTHTDLRPYNCQYCKFSFKTKGNLTKHMKSKAHHKLCTELGLDPVPTAVDDTFINSDVLMKQSLVKGRQMSGASQDDGEDEDDGDDEGDMEYEMVEEDDDMEDSIIIDVEGSGETPEKSMDTAATPKYVALQQPDSAQPTFVRLNEAGDPVVYTPSSEVKQSTVAARKRPPSGDGSPRASIDKEIAASLLDLSKGREQDKDKEAAASGDASKEDTRLDQLIVALVSRTGDKPGEGQGKTVTAGENMATSMAAQSAEDSHATIKALLTTPTPDVLSTPATRSGTTTTSQTTMAKSGFVPPIFIMSGAGLVQIQSPAAGALTTPTFTRQESLSTLIPSLRNIPQPPSSKKKLKPDAEEKVGEGKVESPSGVDTPKDSKTVGNQLSILGLVPTVAPGVPSAAVISRNETEEAVQAITSAASSSAIPVSIHYVTGENRAPFEIHPIPIKVQTESESVDGKYVCDICQKSFNKQHQLIMHRNIHYFERPFKCEDCNLSFKSKALLDKHIRSESHVAKVSLQQQFGPVSSVNPRPFKCEDCNLAFRIHGHLAKHLRSKSHFMKLESLSKIPPGSFAHLEKMQFKGVSFTDSDSSLESIQKALDAVTEGQGDEMKSPEGLHHDASRPDRTSTPRGDTPEAGIVVHTSPIRDNFLYPRLGEFEKDATRSNENVTVEFTNKPIELGEIMNKNSGQRQDEGEIESQEAKCGLCGKTFKEFIKLKDHMVTHAELRPYVCEYCDAGFTNAQALKVHLRTHTQARPYICGMCGANFARSDLLRRHMTLHDRGHMSSLTTVATATATVPSPVVVQSGQSTLLQGVSGNQLLVTQTAQPQTVRILPPLSGANQTQTVQLPTGQPIQLANLGSIPGLGLNVSAEMKSIDVPLSENVVQISMPPASTSTVPYPATEEEIADSSMMNADSSSLQVIEVNPNQIQVQNITETDEHGVEKQTQVLILQGDNFKDMDLSQLGAMPNMFLSEEEANRLVKAGEIVITEAPDSNSYETAAPELSTSESDASQIPVSVPTEVPVIPTASKPSDERGRRKFRRSEAIDASSYEETMGSIVLGGDVFEQGDVSSTETVTISSAPNPQQGTKRPHPDTTDEDYAAKYRVLDAPGGQCSLEPIFAPDNEENN